MPDEIAGLPTEEELRELPRWAVVAFAARCARRVQPLFTAAWPEAPEKQIQEVDKLIAIAADSAGRAIVADALRVATTNEELGVSANLAVHPASAAIHAGSAAAAATQPVPAAGHAAECASLAITTIVDRPSGPYHASAAHSRATRIDFELLKAAAKSEGWSDDTPVPQEFFGPLWPGGEPEGWPDDEREEHDQQMLIQIAVPVDLPDDEVDEIVDDIVLSASELHIAHGGSGLTIDRMKVFEPAAVEVGGGQ